MHEGASFGVGRVGALAVALGVGTGILGFTAVAAADSGSGGTGGSAGQESTRSGASRSAGSSVAGPRRSQRGTPAPAQAVEVPSVKPEVDTSDSEPTSRTRRAGGPRSGANATGTPGRNAGIPSTASQSSTDASLLGALLTPGGMHGLIQDAVVGMLGSVFSAGPAEGVVPRVTSTPEITAVPQAVDTVVEEPPAMTAAASTGALAGGEADPLASLGEGGTGVPGTEPLAWAGAAVARRDELAGPAPEVAPAATVSTGEPIAVAAGALAGAAVNAAASAEAVGAACLTWCALVSNQTTATLITNRVSKQLQAQFNPNILPVATANIIGGYVTNILVGLMNGMTTNQAIAANITGLATNAAVLTFVSNLVAQNPAVSKFPPAVATTIGNAAASFVANSFGNNTVALAFVPVLQAINLPTSGALAGQTGAVFLGAAEKNLFAAVLSSGTNAR